MFGELARRFGGHPDQLATRKKQHFKVAPTLCADRRQEASRGARGSRGPKVARPAQQHRLGGSAWSRTTPSWAGVGSTPALAAVVERTDPRRRGAVSGAAGAKSERRRGAGSICCMSFRGCSVVGCELAAPDRGLLVGHEAFGQGLASRSRVGQPPRCPGVRARFLMYRRFALALVVRGFAPELGPLAAPLRHPPAARERRFRMASHRPAPRWIIVCRRKDVMASGRFRQAALGGPIRSRRR